MELLVDCIVPYCVVCDECFVVGVGFMLFVRMVMRRFRIAELGSKGVVVEPIVVDESQL
jgi:hypothetical protein